LRVTKPREKQVFKASVAVTRKRRKKKKKSSFFIYIEYNLLKKVFLGS
jgi:hypothetical protein